MRSWDELEAYLLGLVKKVGGADYALRDSGGRHLAPRPPPRIDRNSFFEAAFQQSLHEALKADPPPADPVGTVVQNRAREIARLGVRAERFKQHAAVLDDVVGIDFVRKGPGKRYVHRQANLPFIAERFLSSYLLIIAFRDVSAVDAQGVVLALERARATISDMLGSLPPDGGGYEAVSNAMRLR